MAGREAELVQLTGAQLEQLKLGQGLRGLGLELVQLARPLLVQLGLYVGEMRHGGGHRQLFPLRLYRLVQLWPGGRTHLGGIGGRGHRCHVRSLKQG